MLLFLRCIRDFRPTAYTSFDPLTLDGSVVAYISWYSTVCCNLWRTSSAIKQKLRFLKGSPRPRPLGRPRRRWEDNIRMDLQEVGLGYEDWLGLAQDRDRWRALVSAVRNLRVP